MEKITLTIYGIELNVTFEYDEGEKRTRENAGASPEVHIETITAKDSKENIYDVLHDMVIEKIEDKIIESKK